MRIEIDLLVAEYFDSKLKLMKLAFIINLASLPISRGVSR